MASHQVLGKKGEQLAADFLRERQYGILHMNWRYGRKEIDIVARQDNTLVFVEVKTRSGQAFGMPEEAVHSHKQQLLLQAADRYMEQYHLYPDHIRFDIISIILAPESAPEVLHLEDAF